MKDSVLLKGNQHGLAIFMNEDSTFEQIKNDLITKLEGARNFFGANKVTISFDGRKLQLEEQESLVNLFDEHSDLEVLCVLDEEADVSAPFREELNELKSKAERLVSENTKLQYELQQLKDKSTPKVQLDKSDEVIFHYSTLRSGQEVTYDHSIIILGDVNNGARVTAGGNVIVLGKLKGVVHAGLNGTDNAYIVALDMKPVQLRINNTYGRASDESISIGSNTEPRIAFIDNGMIAIENIDNKVFKEIRGN